MASNAHVVVRDLTMAYGDFVVQHELDFEIGRGEIFIVMGGSGCGKSTLMRHLVGLEAPARGKVLYNGESFWEATRGQRQRMMQRFGVMYQSGALWSSMNSFSVSSPMYSATRMRAFG